MQNLGIQDGSNTVCGSGISQTSKPFVIHTLHPSTLLTDRSVLRDWASTDIAISTQHRVIYCNTTLQTL